MLAVMGDDAMARPADRRSVLIVDRVPDVLFDDGEDRERLGAGGIGVLGGDRLEQLAVKGKGAGGEVHPNPLHAEQVCTLSRICDRSWLKMGLPLAS